MSKFTDFARSQPETSEPSSTSDLNQQLHYAVVIDAGSSGSRAYLYAWPSHSGNVQDLLKIQPLAGQMKAGGQTKPLVAKVTPGLSR